MIPFIVRWLIATWTPYMSPTMLRLVSYACHTLEYILVRISYVHHPDKSIEPLLNLGVRTFSWSANAHAGSNVSVVVFGFRCYSLPIITSVVTARLGPLTARLQRLSWWNGSGSGAKPIFSSSEPLWAALSRLATAFVPMPSMLGASPDQAHLHHLHASRNPPPNPPFTFTVPTSPHES